MHSPRPTSVTLGAVQTPPIANAVALLRAIVGETVVGVVSNGVSHRGSRGASRRVPDLRAPAAAHLAWSMGAPTTIARTTTMTMTSHQATCPPNRTLTATSRCRNPLLLLLPKWERFTQSPLSGQGCIERSTPLSRRVLRRWRLRKTKLSKSSAEEAA